MAQLQIVEDHPYYFRNLAAEPGQFKVATVEEGLCSTSSFNAYNRRSFYKISFITKGRSRLFYADRAIDIEQPVLVFTNPLVPYAWENLSDIKEVSGYFCVFTEEFLQTGNRQESLQESSLFKPGGDPVFFLDQEQEQYMLSLFTRMRQEVDSEYVYKYELLRNQLNLVLHQAIKMQPAVAFYAPPNAAARLASLFLGLLDRQFPALSAQEPLRLRRASDYAAKLAVHVNHLNAAVHQITGKSTTAHINERLLNEAKSLLQHTPWGISEIAFSLGFEYASYFNSFFKKHTGSTPLAFRKAL